MTNIYCFSNSLRPLQIKANQATIEVWNHTVYFSSSLYIINQKPMVPRTDFHCITTWVARSSG